MEVGGRQGHLPLSGSGGLVSPVTRSHLSASTDILSTPVTGSSSGVTTVVPGNSSSSGARVSRSVPTATSTVAVGLSSGLGAALGAVAEFAAVRALDTAPVLGLRAVAAVVTLGVTVAATIHARLRAVRRVVTWQEAVEASTASATAGTRLQRLGALSLAVTGLGQQCWNMCAR